MKLFACMLFLCLAWNAESQDQHWVGTLQTKSQPPSPIRFDFYQETGVVFAPSEKLIKTTMVNLKREGSEISFTAGNGSVNYEVHATISGNRMTGAMSSGEINLPFSLVLLAPVTNSKYFGIYSISKTENIYIRTWDELGADQLTYFDDQGNARALYATSETSFFTGPSLMVALPKMADVTF